MNDVIKGRRIFWCIMNGVVLAINSRLFYRGRPHWKSNSDECQASLGIMGYHLRDPSNLPDYHNTIVLRGSNGYHNGSPIMLREPLVSWTAIVIIFQPARVESVMQTADNTLVFFGCLFFDFFLDSFTRVQVGLFNVRLFYLNLGYFYMWSMTWLCTIVCTLLMLHLMSYYIYIAEILNESKFRFLQIERNMIIMIIFLLIAWWKFFPKIWISNCNIILELNAILFGSESKGKLSTCIQRTTMLK